ncbi:MAG: methyltransferase domain-containing protein [Spirochaetes bacterium]|nr:methyltransferase domain-containing protein [Spirochaetota bacterium]
MFIQPASLTAMAQFFISTVIQPGDFVIDATVGNGNDTLFLAEQVGSSGEVLGFDVQSAALNHTQKFLAEKNYHQVKLVEKSHTCLDQYTIKPVKAVMFNLGYLPGKNSSIVTQKQSSIQALEKSLLALKPGGMITVIAYRSHPGGEEEYQAILTKVNQLDERQVKVIQYHFPNSRKVSPVLFVLIKN